MIAWYEVDNYNTGTTLVESTSLDNEIILSLTPFLIHTEIMYCNIYMT